MNVETLTPETRSEAAKVLIDSFYDYPYMRLILRDSGTDYDAHLEALILFILDARWLRGHPVLGTRDGDLLTGVATVVDPGPAASPEAFEELYEDLRERIGEGPCELMEEWEAAAREGRPAEPFHYLGMLGVLPDQQGRGIGKRLVEVVKEHTLADPSSAGICLNTETEGNVGLYRHLGFRVLAEADVDSVHTWLMYWPARESA